MKMELVEGKKARKIGGSYQHTGTIVSRFQTLAGEHRVVFEFDAPLNGCLHIFNLNQVEAMEIGVADWHEKGLLPPVGTVCEFIRYDDVAWPRNLVTGSKVRVLSHYSPCDDGDLVAVFSFNPDGWNQEWRGDDVAQAVAKCFRPLEE